MLKLQLQEKKPKLMLMPKEEEMLMLQERRHDKDRQGWVP